MPVSGEQLWDLRNGLRSRLSRIAESPVDQLVRPELGTQLNFEVLRRHFEDIQRVVKVLADYPIEAIPPYIMKVMLKALAPVEDRYKEIMQFQVANPSEPQRHPVEAREAILSAFDESERVFFEISTPVLGFLAALPREEDGTDHTSISNVVEEIRDTLTLAKDAQKELHEIVSASRTAAADVGVAQHAAHFAQEATAHEQAAKGWLRTTIVAACVTLVVGAVNLGLAWSMEGPVEAGRNIQLIVAKVIVISLLLSATAWCAKGYRASRHNVVVNRHR
jgi:hypothetical protein